MKIFDLRKIKWTIPLLLICVLCVSLSPNAMALEDPACETPSAILYDMDAGVVLYSKDENVSRAPASLTKIMTVMLAAEAVQRGDLKLADLVTVGEDIYFDIADDGSSAGLAAGEVLSLEELLYLTMLSSANEGCNVIAQAVSGNIQTFISLMNERARELGCTGTNFANTHGMPNDAHYSTAHDLMLITEKAMSLSLFRRIASTQSYTVPETNLHEARTFQNTNNLLNESSIYYYEYATGVKTGYTDAAGYCLVSTATKEGRQLLCVVLGGASYIAADGRTLTQNFTESTRLLEWGFNNFSYQELLSTLDLITEIPVDLGLGASSVVLRPSEDLTALLPNDADLSQVRLTPTIFNEEETLVAPVSQGTVLGQIEVWFEGVNYGSVNLVANSTVELNRTAYITRELNNTLSNKYVRLTITVLIVLLILYVAFIVYYNIRRVQKRRAAAALAKRRVAAIRSKAGATTGKSFEEIEAQYRERERRIAKETVTTSPRTPTGTKK